MDVKNKTIRRRTSKNRVEPGNIHGLQLQLQHVRQSTKWLGSSTPCQTNLGLVGWKRLGEDQDSECRQEILWNKETKIQRYILAKNVFEIHIWYHRLQQGWYYLQWYSNRDVLDVIEVLPDAIENHAIRIDSDVDIGDDDVVEVSGLLVLEEGVRHPNFIWIRHCQVFNLPWKAICYYKIK